MNEYGPPEPEEVEEQPRHRIRRVKKPEVMLKECEAYVMARKRLPILHSRWLYNNYVNSQSSEYALAGAHKYTLFELKEARQTIIELQRRITELESEEAC